MIIYGGLLILQPATKGGGTTDRIYTNSRERRREDRGSREIADRQQRGHREIYDKRQLRYGQQEAKSH